MTVLWSDYWIQNLLPMLNFFLAVLNEIFNCRFMQHRLLLQKTSTNVSMMDAFLIELNLCTENDHQRVHHVCDALYFFFTFSQQTSQKKLKSDCFSCVFDVVEKHISKQSLRHIPCNKSIWSFLLTFFHIFFFISCSLTIHSFPEHEPLSLWCIYDKDSSSSLLKLYFIFKIRYSRTQYPISDIKKLVK